MVLTLWLAFLAQQPLAARTFYFGCLKFGESCPPTVTTAIMVRRGRKTYTFDSAMKRFTCPVRQPCRVWTLRPNLAPTLGYQSLPGRQITNLVLRNGLYPYN